MQLNAVLVALAVGCGPCHCRGAQREQWGAPPASLLARQSPATATPAPQVPVATLGTGDPALTEALAVGLPDPVGPIPEDAAEVEMASTSEALVRMAVANVTGFQEYVVEKLMLVCMAPPSQFLVRLQSDLGTAHEHTEDAQVFKEVPQHPTLSLAQRGRRMLRRATRQAAAQTAKINITAVMWVVFIMPPNLTANETNVTNVTNVTCAPCPCAPKGPPPLFPGLSANETAALAGRSAKEIADDLVEQAVGGDTPLHGLLPLTTVRRAHQNFPAIQKNSVTIGSHATSAAGAAESDTGRSVEATEINQGTQELVKELRARLQAANEARAAVLTGDQVPAPSLDGFTVPVASGDDSPWSNLDFEPEPEPQGLRGHR